MLSAEVNFKMSGHIKKHNCVSYDVTNPYITTETILNQPGVLFSHIIP